VLELAARQVRLHVLLTKVQPHDLGLANRLPDLCGFADPA
jgi:hypothetical protein